MQDEFTRDPLGGASRSRFQPGGYTITIVAHMAMAAVIIYTTSINADSALPGVIGGVLYFGVAAQVSLLILSGGLPAMYIARQEQITMRARDALQWGGQDNPRIQVADPLPTLGAPAPQLGGSTFVPPHAPSDDSARREAVAFGLQLYGADGLPDPRKVVVTTDKEQPGRLRIAAPRGEARQWLMDRRCLVDLGNGFALALDRFPTLDKFRAVL